MAHTFLPLWRSITRSVAAFIFCLALLVGIHVTAQTGNDITYIYDELGRLVAVIDPVGDTAVYTYDAVGNLLSISRHSSSTVSIIHFSPKSGPVGSTVTIYGTGFSATPAQNTVTFNGEAGVVSSATATQLVTTVPSGATTGPISVNTPSGSAISGSPFTVNANALAPTISGFSPTIGDPGTAVSVTGTNFEVVATNNQATFNGTLAPVTSSTATSLTAYAPSQPGVGHISVTTPFGTAVSTNHFFIPPAPYPAADIETTDWIEVGQSKTVTVTTAGKVAALFFEGTAGQRKSVKFSGLTTSTFVTVFSPNGMELSYTYAETVGGLLEPASLPAAGNYIVIVSPLDSSNQPTSGSATLTLYDVPADVTGTITAGGSPVTVTTTVPGQNASLTFTGTVGQKVSLSLSNITIPSSYIWIEGPDSSFIADSSVTTSPVCIEDLILAVGGTYRIFVDPQVAHTGSMTLKLFSVTDVNSTITRGGPPVTVVTTLSGQYPKLTFSGTAGDAISMKASNVTIPGLSTVSIIRPDGATIAWDYADAIGGFIDVEELPVTGTYTILVHPQCANIGSITMTLYAAIPSGSGVPTITGLAPTIGAPATTLTITGTDFETTASNNRISFNGRLSIVDTATSTSIETTVPTGATSGHVSVTTPAGKAVSSSDFFVPPAPYTVGDVESTERISFGDSTMVTLSDADNIALIVFDGTQGQHVSLKASGASLYASVQVISPDGTIVSYGSASTYQDTLTEVEALPATGTYTILVVPSYSTGEVTLTLYNVPAEVTGTISANGQPVTVTTTVPGQNARLTFSGTAGQRVSLKTTSGTMNGDKNISLISPDGTVLAWTQAAFENEGFIDTQTLPLAGTYTIKIDPMETIPGTFTLTLYNVPADVVETILADGPPVTVTTTVPGQNAVLTFSGTAGQRVKLNVSEITMGGAYVFIKVSRPDGSYLEGGNVYSDWELLTYQPLPVTGTYSILMEPYVAVGSVTFTLENLPPE